MLNVSSRIDFNTGDIEESQGRSYLGRGEKPDLESLIRADPLSDHFLNSSTSFLKESGICSFITLNPLYMYYVVVDRRKTR